MTHLQEAFQVAALTDPGMVRAHNEDAIATDAEHGIIILADGMGGYNAGEVASTMTVSLMMEGLRGDLKEQPLRAIAEASNLERAHTLLEREVVRANQAVLTTSREQPQCAGMGTTLVAGLFYDNQLTAVHIGDSRLYRYRAGHLEVLTRDHSLLQEQIDSGLLTAEEARFAAHRNLVTRALGIDDQVEPEFNQYAVAVGDVYLFCSDGLNDMIDDEEIALILESLSANLPLAVQHLIQAANDNGGRDNVSAILVRIDRDFSVPRGLWSRIKAMLFR